MFSSTGSGYGKVSFSAVQPFEQRGQHQLSVNSVAGGSASDSPLSPPKTNDQTRIGFESSASPSSRDEQQNIVVDVRSSTKHEKRSSETSGDGNVGGRGSSGTSSGGVTSSLSHQQLTMAQRIPSQNISSNNGDRESTTNHNQDGHGVIIGGSNAQSIEVQDVSSAPGSLNSSRRIDGGGDVGPHQATASHTSGLALVFEDQLTRKSTITSASSGGTTTDGTNSTAGGSQHSGGGVVGNHRPKQQTTNSNGSSCTSEVPVFAAKKKKTPRNMSGGLTPVSPQLGTRCDEKIGSMTTAGVIGGADIIGGAPPAVAAVSPTAGGGVRNPLAGGASRSPSNQQQTNSTHREESSRKSNNKRKHGSPSEQLPPQPSQAPNNVEGDPMMLEAYEAYQQQQQQFYGDAGAAAPVRKTGLFDRPKKKKDGEEDTNSSEGKAPLQLLTDEGDPNPDFFAKSLPFLWYKSPDVELRFQASCAGDLRMAIVAIVVLISCLWYALQMEEPHFMYDRYLSISIGAAVVFVVEALLLAIYHRIIKPLYFEMWCDIVCSGGGTGSHQRKCCAEKNTKNGPWSPEKQDEWDHFSLAKLTAEELNKIVSNLNLKEHVPLHLLFLCFDLWGAVAMLWVGLQVGLMASYQADPDVKCYWVYTYDSRPHDTNCPFTLPPASFVMWLLFTLILARPRFATHLVPLGVGVGAALATAAPTALAIVARTVMIISSASFTAYLYRLSESTHRLAFEAAQTLMAQSARLAAKEQSLVKFINSVVPKHLREKIVAEGGFTSLSADIASNATVMAIDVETSANLTSSMLPHEAAMHLAVFSARCAGLDLQPVSPPPRASELTHIRSVGDTSIVVGGLFDKHVEPIVFLDFAQYLKTAAGVLPMRCGIAEGVLLGLPIGRLTIRYDVFGPALQEAQALLLAAHGGTFNIAKSVLQRLPTTSMLISPNGAPLSLTESVPAFLVAEVQEIETQMTGDQEANQPLSLSLEGQDLTTTSANSGQFPPSADPSASNAKEWSEILKERVKQQKTKRKQQLENRKQRASPSSKRITKELNSSRTPASGRLAPAGASSSHQGSASRNVNSRSKIDVVSGSSITQQLVSTGSEQQLSPGAGNSMTSPRQLSTHQIGGGFVATSSLNSSIGGGASLNSPGDFAVVAPSDDNSAESETQQQQQQVLDLSEEVLCGFWKEFADPTTDYAQSIHRCRLNCFPFGCSCVFFAFQALSTSIFFLCEMDGFGNLDTNGGAGLGLLVLASGLWCGAAYLLLRSSAVLVTGREVGLVVIASILGNVGVHNMRPSVVGDNTVNFGMVLSTAFIYASTSALSTVSMQLLWTLLWVSLTIAVRPLLTIGEIFGVSTFLPISMVMLAYQRKKERQIFTDIVASHQALVQVEEQSEIREALMEGTIPKQIQYKVNSHTVSRFTLDTWGVETCIVMCVSFFQHSATGGAAKDEFEQLINDDTEMIKAFIEQRTTVIENAVRRSTHGSMAIVNVFCGTAILVSPIEEQPTRPQEHAAQLEAVTDCLDIVRDLLVSELNFTVGISVEQAVHVLRQTEFPAHDIFGPAVNVAKTLMMEAPSPMIVATEQLFKLIEREPDLRIPSGIQFNAQAESWRLRGVGSVRVRQLRLNASMMQRSQRFHNSSTNMFLGSYTSTSLGPSSTTNQYLGGSSKKGSLRHMISSAAGVAESSLQSSANGSAAASGNCSPRGGGAGGAPTELGALERMIIVDVSERDEVVDGGDSIPTPVTTKSRSP